MIRWILVMFLTLAACRADPPDAPAEAAPPAPAAYTVISVEEPGEVTGVVRYAGAIDDAPVTVDRDQATCASAGRGPSGALMVTDGKVANAVVEVVGVREGMGFETQRVRIDNVGCVFVPRVALARTGDTFVSHNSDPVFHNAKLEQQRGARTKRIANLPVPLQNTDSPGRVLDKPGVVTVSCDAHLWMRSTVYVTDHPYATLTDSEGRFAIQGLPPGDYTLKVWHEVLGERTAPVTVQPGAPANADLAL